MLRLINYIHTFNGLYRSGLRGILFGHVGVTRCNFSISAGDINPVSISKRSFPLTDVHKWDTLPPLCSSALTPSPTVLSETDRLHISAFKSKYSSFSAECEKWLRSIDDSSSASLIRSCSLAQVPVAITGFSNSYCHTGPQCRHNHLWPNWANMVSNHLAYCSSILTLTELLLAKKQML